jgi:hypothetical protein
MIVKFPLDIFWESGKVSTMKVTKQMKRIFDECDKVRERVSGYSPKKRAALLKEARRSLKK